MNKPKSVGIAVSQRETAQLVFDECKKIFDKKKATITIAKELELETLKQNKEFLQSDIIICFGGDGTFLKVCQAIQTKTPIFSVGCGERNILATIEAEEAPQQIEEILQGRYSIEPRTRIELVHANAPPALNEIAIVPKKSATVMHYELVVDGKAQWNDYADGILVATPTGSNAYFSSLHNPRIETSAPVLGISPINSLEKKRALIISKSKKIVVQKIFCTEGIEIVLDGQQRIPAEKEIQIQSSPHPCWIGKPLAGTIQQHNLRASLKPSSRFVLLNLTIHGAGTQEDLIKQTGLNARTVRRAINQLIQKKLVSKRQFGKDKRQWLYHPLVSRQMQNRFLEETKPGNVKSAAATIERLKKRLMP